MSKFIPNPHNPKYNAHSHHVLPMLGFTAGGHLPNEGTEPRELHGITVWVRPIAPGSNAQHRHRVMAKCPTCGRTLSVGRLHQHVDTARCVRNVLRAGR